MSGKANLPIKEISNQDIGLAIIMNEKLPITPSWRFGQWKEGTEKMMKSVNKKREDMIKELGHTKEDGTVEVKPENKQKYFDQYKLLLDEKAEITIPEISISMLKDIPLTLRFTTLIGGYLNNDLTKFKTEVYSLTNQQILDMDLGLSIIMNEKLPTILAIKLGEAKRTAEVVSIELREKRDSLTKALGELNSKFDYEIKDSAKKEEFDKKVEDWLAETREITVPLFLLNEFEAKVGEKETDIKLPLRFFTLFSPFIKEKEENKEEKKKPANGKKAVTA